MTRQLVIGTSIVVSLVSGAGRSVLGDDWSMSVAPWRAPTALSRSTAPTSIPGPFNSYDPTYGSYPDPLQWRNTVSPNRTAGGYNYGASAYSKYAPNAHRVTAGYGGAEYYYGGEMLMQPEAVAPAEAVPPMGEQVYPPLEQVPAPFDPAPVPGVIVPGGPAPMLSPPPCDGACAPPCVPACPASWQHRCGQRLGAMLTRMRECCDDFCTKLAECFQCPRPQPCCWTGYQAPWHAPQQFGYGCEGGYPGYEAPLGEAGPVDVEEGFANASDYETVSPDMMLPAIETDGEIVEDGPVFYEYSRPLADEISVEKPATPAGRVVNGGEVEAPADEPIEVEAPELPTPMVVPPREDDSVT